MPKAASVEEKLLLKPDEKVFLVNPPRDLPFLSVAKSVDLADAVLIYAIKAAELPKHIEVVSQVPPEARLWVVYPKAGKLATDLGRDKLWIWMKEQGFEGVRLVSVDDTWSAFWFKRV
jgi:hypothetical protein